MHIQHLVKFCQLVLIILSRNEDLTSIKSHNSVANLSKIIDNNPKLDIVNINKSERNKAYDTFVS